MKKRILSILCLALCLTFVTLRATNELHHNSDNTKSCEAYTFSYMKMGIPDEIADYIEAHGMDWMNGEDLNRAHLQPVFHLVQGNH